MCLSCIPFRAPHAALKHKNGHNSQSIISYFHGIVTLLKRHPLATLSKQLNVFRLCYRPDFLFLFFLFLVIFLIKI